MVMGRTWPADLFMAALAAFSHTAADESRLGTAAVAAAAHSSIAKVGTDLSKVFTFIMILLWKITNCILCDSIMCYI